MKKSSESKKEESTDATETKSSTSTATPVLDPAELFALHAEDNAVNQKTFPKVLDIAFKDRYKFKWRIANDGLEAVAAADEEKFDIIFMDDQMPKMKGSEASPIIRKHSKLNKDTVIITNSDTKQGAYRDPDSGEFVSEHQIAKPTNKQIILKDEKFINILEGIATKKLIASQDKVDDGKEADDKESQKTPEFLLSTLSLLSGQDKKDVNSGVKPHHDAQAQESLEPSGASTVSGDAPGPDPDESDENITKRKSTM